MNLKELLESDKKSTFVRRRDPHHEFTKEQMMKNIEMTIKHGLSFSKEEEDIIKSLEERLKNYAQVPKDIEEKTREFLRTIPQHSKVSVKNS